MFGPGDSIIKYEDLVTNPIATFEGIHTLLDLEFYKSQLSEAFTKRVVGGDPKFNESKDIHTDRIYAWKKQDESTREELLRCAELCGIIDKLEEYCYDKN